LGTYRRELRINSGKVNGFADAKARRSWDCSAQANEAIVPVRAQLGVTENPAGLRDSNPADAPENARISGTDYIGDSVPDPLAFSRDTASFRLPETESLTLADITSELPG
jgi:hypothetical protein